MEELLQSRDARDPIQNTREWQAQQLSIQPGDYIDAAAECNEITHLSANILTLFKEIVLSLPKLTQIPNDARINVERSCSALILWSDGYGIAQGRLNDTFNKSRKLRHTAIKSLLHIGRILTERLVPLTEISSEKLQLLCSCVESSIEEANGVMNEDSGHQSDDSSSDAESAFSDGGDIYEIAEDLRTDTRVLSGLDPLLKCPIFDLRHEEGIEGHAPPTWSPEQSFSDKIQHRFPCAGAALASRLGSTNYERYLRCQADRDAHRGEEAQPAANRRGQDAFWKKARYRLRGPGIGISPLEQTRIYPETVMMSKYDGQSVRIPQLPKDAKTGLPFPCIACGRTVVIINNADWK
ncbi:ankyrin repeat [Trichoderma cornu-damae]|uniref:Ankyrin repeat n=1 Tax=Trichoderma cornu-damae TaxID=654480 RepID=A0A9P8QG01_9HYPO|nr:ankyrin repeat [Trichoderma cornu-damae]